MNNFQVKHNALDNLLTILKSKTARTITVQSKSGMEYLYFALSEEIMKNVARYPCSVTDNLNALELSFNIDGLPLFKRSQETLWPVLCSIANIKPAAVFPVALRYGKSKPKDLTFLEEVIRGLGYIMEHGIQYDDKCLSVSLRCIVCDAPARALVQGTTSYSGYFGCDKCCQKGRWDGRVIYA